LRDGPDPRIGGGFPKAFIAPAVLFPALDALTIFSPIDRSSACRGDVHTSMSPRHPGHPFTRACAHVGMLVGSIYQFIKVLCGHSTQAKGGIAGMHVITSGNL